VTRESVYLCAEFRGGARLPWRRGGSPVFGEGHGNVSVADALCARAPGDAGLTFGAAGAHPVSGRAAFRWGQCTLDSPPAGRRTSIAKRAAIRPRRSHPHCLPSMGNNQASSQAAAISFVAALQQALPQTPLVMIGPAFGSQAWHRYAMQVTMPAAPDPTRMRMNDSITQGWATGASSAGWFTTDAVRWGVEGKFKWRSPLPANAIAHALLDRV